MARALPSELMAAKRSAECYRVKQSAPGRFNVWRFRSWDLPEPGWRVVAIVGSPDVARSEIEERLGLRLEPPKAIPAEPCFAFTDYAWP